MDAAKIITLVLSILMLSGSVLSQPFKSALSPQYYFSTNQSYLAQRQTTTQEPDDEDEDEESDDDDDEE